MVGDDLRFPVPDAPIVIPAAGLESSLEGDLLALAEELATGLCQPIPRDDVVIFGLFLALADVLVCGDAELRHGLAARQAAHLRVAGEATSQKDLVHGPRSPSRSADGKSGRPCVVPAGSTRRARAGWVTAARHEDERQPSSCCRPRRWDPSGCTDLRWSADRRSGVRRGRQEPGGHVER